MIFYNINQELCQRLLKCQRKKFLEQLDSRPPTANPREPPLSLTTPALPNTPFYIGKQSVDGSSRMGQILRSGTDNADR